MSRRLLGLNVLLAILSLLFLTYIVRQVTLPRPVAAPRPAAPAAAPRAPDAPAPSPQGYSVITARNLFSPTRSESTARAGATGAPALRKPSLHGIILSDWATVAYLEDPVTKRVAGYRAGDAVAGGTVETISWDRVVIVRPEGKMDVLLYDPARPRPAAQRAVPSPPSPAGASAVGPTRQQPSLTESPVVPPRGPGPPVIIRRPPPTSPDATPQ